MAVDGFAELADVIDGAPRHGAQDSAMASVVRIDDEGTVWVHFDGGVDEMPVHKTLYSVKPGDMVPVRISGGRAEIAGNGTDMPMSSSDAAMISDAAMRAMSDAAAASAASADARATAEAVHGIAIQAEADAVAASTAALNAQTSADAAGDAASTAQEKLADIEDVVGTVNWIADHAVPTDDETAVDGVTYYSRDDGTGTMQRVDSDVIQSTYTPTQDSSPQQGKTYYELSDDSYALTQDTEPDPDKTYYIYSGGSYIETTTFPFTYVHTSDVSVIPDKIYYSRTVPEYGYALTSDDAPIQGKQYYTQDGTPLGDIPSTYATTSDVSPQPGKTYYTREESYEYVHTQDVSPQPGKTYYIYDSENEQYVEVDDPSAEHMADYYEYILADVSYDEVDEPTVEDMPSYYERSYDMSEVYEYAVVSYTYEEVANPVDSEISDYYEAAYDMSGIYELTAAHYVRVETPVAADMGDYFELGNPKAQGLYTFNEAIRDYIATHLAMTERGLYVASSQDGAYRLLAATDGVYIYNDSDELVGKYSESMQIGSLSGTHMEAAGDYLLFLPAGVTTDGYDMDDPDDVASILSKSVAYIAIDDNGNSTFYMTRSVVVEDMYFGDGLWKFYRRSNRNMSLKWMGGE